MSLYRIDIAPLTPLPLTRAPFFSYRSDQALALGSLVQVPFGRRSLRGIVYACTPLPGRAPLWLKPVERVIREGWLTLEQRSLAEVLSETYFSSLGNTLKHFVFPLSNKGIAPAASAVSPKKSRARSLKEAGIQFGNDQTLQEWLQETLEKNLAKNEATLVLVPDLFLLATLEQALQKTLGEGILALSSKLTPKQMETAWQDIRTGKARIILGTRQAIFAPFAHLRHILFLYPEERLSYKQWDMTPYYEALFGARTLTKLFKASLTLLTPSPGVLATAFPKEWRQLPATYPTPSFLLIDCRLEGKGARSKIISKEIDKHLKILSSSAKALFIAKERGVSGVMICQHCRTTARCPSCAHPLAENKDGALRCLHCLYESSIFPKCAKCGHMHFKGFGIGTVRVERELERRFPEKRFLRIDRDSLKKAEEFKTIVKKFTTNQYDWLIATPEIGTLLQLPKQDLIVMLEADHALAFPDFEGEEWLGIEVKRLQAKLGPQGTLAIQTFTPEERIWQWLTNNQDAKLWQALFEERESFGYPPVTAIIKISLPTKPKTSTVPDLSLIQKRFVKALEDEEQVEISPVYIPKKKWGTSAPSFLIKYPANELFPTSLITLLKRESAHLKIDIHPLQLH